MTEAERLKNILLSADPIRERDLDDDWGDGELEEIADHLLANGVRALRVKLNDIVYIVRPWFDKIRVIEARIFCIFLSCKVTQYRFAEIDRADTGDCFYEKDLGKTVFLTREEAEEMAERMRGGEWS